MSVLICYIPFDFHPSVLAEIWPSTSLFSLVMEMVIVFILILILLLLLTPTHFHPHQWNLGCPPTSGPHPQVHVVSNKWHFGFGNSHSMLVVELSWRPPLRTIELGTELWELLVSIIIINIIRKLSHQQQRTKDPRRTALFCFCRQADIVRGRRVTNHPREYRKTKTITSA